MHYTKRIATAALMLATSTVMVQATQKPSSPKPAVAAKKDSGHAATKPEEAKAKGKPTAKKMHKDSAATKKP